MIFTTLTLSDNLFLKQPQGAECGNKRVVFVAGWTGQYFLGSLENRMSRFGNAPPQLARVEFQNWAEREVLIDRLRKQGISSAEEVCLRARGGTPIWVIARRTVASYVDDVPELLQGTFVDITAQKKAEARLRDITGGQSSGATPEGESAGISDLPQLSDLSHG